MKFEAAPGNDTEVHPMETSYRSIMERVEKLVRSVRETVEEDPVVMVNGEVVKFKIEQDPDLVYLAEAQALKHAIEQLRAGAIDAKAGRNVEDGLNLLKGHVEGFELALMNKADATTRAARDSEAQRVVELMDKIAETLLMHTNDNEPSAETQQRVA